MTMNYTKTKEQPEDEKDDQGFLLFSVHFLMSAVGMITFFGLSTRKPAGIISGLVMLGVLSVCCMILKRRQPQ